MWTFNILKRTKTDENTVEIVVEFTKGVNTFTKIFTATRDNLSRNWLDSQIKREVDIFENGKQFVTEVKTGAYTLSPEATPTQEQVNQVNFVTKARKLINMNRLVQVGVLQASDLDALRQEVVSLYNENWTEFI